MTNWATYQNSLSELKAIDCTFLKKGTPAVWQNWYFYDPTSVEVADDFLIVQPNSGTGRWMIAGYPSAAYLSQPNTWAKAQRSHPINLSIDPFNPSLTIDARASNFFLLDATTSFSIVTPIGGESGSWFILSIQQPATPFLISWSGNSFRYMGKTPPQLTPEAGAIDEILFRCRSGGIAPVWLISAAGNFGVSI